MNKKSRFFSIIVPAFNEEKYIFDCVQSLKQQDHTGDFEIIIVDNGSEDGTAKIAKSLGVKVISEPKRGVSHALIAGVKEARGEILAFTDADTRPPKFWLSKLNNAFNISERVVAAGGAPHYYDGPAWADAFLHKILVKLYIRYLKDKQQGLAGCNMAVRKDIYHKTGGYEPGFDWGQDWKMAKKASLHGEVIFDPEIFVHTSFRRFYGDHKHPVLKTARAIKEILVAGARMIPMAGFNKNLKAQKPIR